MQFQSYKDAWQMSEKKYLRERKIISIVNKNYIMLWGRGHGGRRDRRNVWETTTSRAQIVVEYCYMNTPSQIKQVIVEAKEKARQKRSFISDIDVIEQVMFKRIISLFTWLVNAICQSPLLKRLFMNIYSIWIHIIHITF